MLSLPVFRKYAFIACGGCKCAANVFHPETALNWKHETNHIKKRLARALRCARSVTTRNELHVFYTRRIYTQINIIDMNLIVYKCICANLFYRIYYIIIISIFYCHIFWAIACSLYVAYKMLDLDYMLVMRLGTINKFLMYVMLYDDKNNGNGFFFILANRENCVQIGRLRRKLARWMICEKMHSERYDTRGRVCAVLCIRGKNGI